MSLEDHQWNGRSLRGFGLHPLGADQRFLIGLLALFFLECLASFACSCFSVRAHRSMIVTLRMAVIMRCVLVIVFLPYVVLYGE